ncbi:MAG: ankyrin repeat domain-containing protein, partial [Planctomycetota bacterium]
VSMADGDGSTPLMAAAAGQSNTTILDLLLLAGADLEARDPQGWTALMYAANLSEYPKLVAHLIEQGASIEAVDEEGRTPLLIAAAWNPKPAVASYLMLAGSDRTATDEYLDWNPMFWAAAQNPNTEVLSLFLSDEVTVNSVDDLGESLLMAAASFNPEVAMTQFLLDQGADFAFRSKEEVTPLMSAAMNPNPEVTKALLKAGADPKAVDQAGSTALMVAAEFQLEPEVVHLLLQAGCDVAAVDEDRWTALHFASETMNPDIMDILIAAGAKVDARTADMDTALILAGGYSENLEVALALLEAGADLEAANDSRMTPLLQACMSNGIGMVRFLLEQGADPTAVSFNGQSAIDLAGLLSEEGAEEKRALLKAAIAKKKAATSD